MNALEHARQVAAYFDRMYDDRGRRSTRFCVAVDKRRADLQQPLVVSRIKNIVECVAAKLVPETEGVLTNYKYRKSSRASSSLARIARALAERNGLGNHLKHGKLPPLDCATLTLDTYFDELANAARMVAAEGEETVKDTVRDVNSRIAADFARWGMLLRDHRNLLLIAAELHRVADTERDRVLMNIMTLLVKRDRSPTSEEVVRIVAEAAKKPPG